MTTNCRPFIELLENRFLLTTVTNLQDSGPGSLRDAIASTPVFGTVDFQPGLTGTITLTSSPIIIDHALKIAGPGASVLTVSGGDSLQVFINHVVMTVDNPVIDGLSIRNGRGTDGGGVFNDGILTLHDCTIAGNSATGQGAGFENSGRLVLDRCLVSNNAVLGNGNGGGVLNNGFLLVTNSTFVGNTTGSAGGAIAVCSAGSVNLYHVTITANTASAGGDMAVLSGNTILLENTIVAQNSAATGPDLSGLVTDADHDLIGDGTGSSGIDNGVNGNHVGTADNQIDARLGHPQDNGGPTPTVALLADSPAIDAGLESIGVYLPTDQRGFNRMVNNAPDIGAYEYQPPATTTVVLTSVHPSTPNQRVIIIANVSGVAPGSNIPPGFVTLADNGVELATLPLINGSASFYTSWLTGGNHALTARYSGYVRGDYVFNSSTSTPFPQAVRSRTFFAVAATAELGVNDGTQQFRIYGLDGTLRYSFGRASLNSQDYSIASGDLYANGFDDLVKTDGYNPGVTIYDGRKIADGTFNPDTDYHYFNVMPLRFGGGYTVAIGDVNGDGYLDLVVAANASVQGDTPLVKVYDGRAFANGTFDYNNPDASLLTQFAPYDPRYRVGINVAVGDITGDGYADIITGANRGNPHVKVFSGKAIANGTFDPNNPDASLLASYFAYGLNFNVGVNVAVGDVNDDGFADIITGASIGNPHVKVYDGQAIANGTFNPEQSILDQFFAFDLNQDLGVSVGTADFIGDGRADVITGSATHIRQYRVVDGLHSSGVKPPAINGIEGALMGTFHDPFGVRVA
jgi:hypothetical protein